MLPTSLIFNYTLPFLGIISQAHNFVKILAIYTVHLLILMLYQYQVDNISVTFGYYVTLQID